MVVYVEYVLIDNFIIDYLLLKGTLKMTGVQTGKPRLVLCSLLGGVFSLTYPLTEKAGWLQTVIKIAFGLLLVLLAGKRFTLKKYYASVLVFFCYTFALGGAILGLGYVLGVNFTTEVSIALIFIPACVVFRCVSKVLKYIYERRRVERYSVTVQVTVGNVTATASGFYDTGNLLYDGDSPVIICNKAFAKQFFASASVLPKIKTITVSTVNGKSQKPSFKLDQLVIYDGDKPNIFNNVSMCVAGCDAHLGEIILHPDLSEVKNVKTVAL